MDKSQSMQLMKPNFGFLYSEEFWYRTIDEHHSNISKLNP